MSNDATLDARVRYAIYEHYVRTSRAPTVNDVSTQLREPVSHVTGAFARLADDHTIVLRAGTTEIMMAHPFSSVPTNYQTHIGEMTYSPNCGWDAMGIAALIGQPSRITFRCADCGNPVEFSVVDGKLENESLRMHFAVPARDWWNDIEYT